MMTEGKNALGLAFCKGVNRGKPGTSHWAKCARSAMCPKCEYDKAKFRAWQINKRILKFDEETNGEMAVGVLTLTGPGMGSTFRTADLRTQYDHMTARVRIPGFPSDHSMRGVNKLLTDHGASGGTHFLEFTYNNDPNSKAYQCWNTHTHSVFWGDERLSILKDCSTWRFPDEDSWFGEKGTRSRQAIGLERLGFGRRYTLDYATDEELESIAHYSNKVAYATKPFKAPLAKSAEIQEFLAGVGGPEPRLARPFGDAIKGLGLQDFLSWDRCQRKKERALALKEALRRSPRDQPDRMSVVKRSDLPLR